MLQHLRTSRCTLALLVVGSLAISAPAHSADDGGDPAMQSFEFPDSTTSFVFGQSPTRAFVEGAASVFVGDLSLYNIGFYAWLIEPGVVGTITLETPAEMFRIFARRSVSDVQGVVQLLDVNGGLILEVTPDANDFQQIVRPASAPLVAQLRVVNTGTTGVISLDDFFYCAASTLPDVGVSVCGPAVVNGSGAPGILRAVGTSFQQANNVTLVADQLPTQVTGFLLGSMSQDFIANPGGSFGNLCLGGAIGRFVGPGQVMNSGGSGGFSLPLDLTQLPTPTGPVAAIPGQTWAFQAWYRDAQGGVVSSNFTDALELTFR